MIVQIMTNQDGNIYLLPPISRRYFGHFKVTQLSGCPGQARKQSTVNPDCIDVCRCQPWTKPITHVMRMTARSERIALISNTDSIPEVAYPLKTTRIYHTLKSK